MYHGDAGRTEGVYFEFWIGDSGLRGKEDSGAKGVMSATGEEEAGASKAGA